MKKSIIRKVENSVNVVFKKEGSKEVVYYQEKVLFGKEGTFELPFSEGWNTTKEWLKSEKRGLKQDHLFLGECVDKKIEKVKKAQEKGNFVPVSYTGLEKTYCDFKFQVFSIVGQDRYILLAKSDLVDRLDKLEKIWYDPENKVMVVVNFDNSFKAIYTNLLILGEYELLHFTK